MSTNDYARGFTDALEYALEIFNRLRVKENLPEACKNCKFVEKVGDLMLLAKDKQFEKIGSELGFFLH
jgi:hypothetical protein